MTQPKVSFGTAGIGSLELSVTKNMLEIMDKYHATEIDTAVRYVCVLPSTLVHMFNVYRSETDAS